MINERNKRKLGARIEQMVKEYLLRHGFII